MTAADPKGNPPEVEEDDEDDATVVVDLAMLQKLKNGGDIKGEDGEEIIPELDFGSNSNDDDESTPAEEADNVPSFPVLLFEYGKPLFEATQPTLPIGFEYELIKDVNVLSSKLKGDEFKIVLFNYDGNPKAVNTLSGQIKSKFPKIKTIIFAKNISPDKAAIHKASASGADGYISGEIETEKVKAEFLKIYKSN
jgi:hypothetical protein